jgi:imidazolonepropionase
VTSTLVTGIGLLVTHDDSRPTRTDAALVIEDGLVAWVGDAVDAPVADEALDVEGRCVIPGFVDSHSHVVFAGDRADEFEARMAGTPYEAGGIRRTVRLTREASDDALLTNAQRLVAEARAQGTTTLEIKSGYGLTVEDEARALRAASTLTPETTFLGAHVVPAEFENDRDAYVDLVCGDMLAACAPFSRWIDVFCETGAFTVEESRRILTAGAAAGLGLRMHAAQLGPAPDAIALGVSLGAASIDHCTYLTAADIDALAGSTTVATLLPGVEFSTRHPYPDARALVDAGVTIALACDCNPGSSYTSSMPLCIALAVREMGLTPYEALRAATLGGAQALRRDDIGHLAVGVRADLVVLDAPSYVHLAYRPGVPLVHRVLAERTSTW